jgi:hypothetical protein
MRSTIRSVGLALALAIPAAANAETTLCTDITSAPYAITAPGIYCLKNSVTGDISIQADDVVLDLNGHVIEPLKPGSGSGIWASDRANITVRNGTIRGFHYGIQISGSKGSRSHLLEHLKITDSLDSAIILYGNGSVVRKNMLLNNGFDTGPGARFVLYASGDGIHIADNEIVESGIGVTVNEVVGIRTNGSGIAVERNVVSNVEIGPHNSRGIIVNGVATARNSVVGNRIVNMKIGIMNGFGSAGPAVFMDNTVGGATFGAFFFGVMAGTTNTSF